MFYRLDGRLLLRVDSLLTEVRTVVVDECEIPLANAEDIIDISCDSSGHVSVLGMCMVCEI